ncbi:MAG: hypothetical protein QXL20_02650 [Candidatus Bathyarchaeia archaeon]
MEPDLAEEYYQSEVVRGEVADYCRGRWVAIEGGSLGNRVFLRYWRDGRPLSINSPQDVWEILKHFRGINPRAIYGSINIYKSLSDRLTLEEPSNIAYTSPIWDIDGELSEWRGIIEVARIIVDELERLGIVKSVFIKWSGEGAHVHVHEKCFSNQILLEYNPLDIAYSLVDLVLERCREKILDVASKFKSIKVENEIDMERVFTAPLSLHRRRNLCCICFKPSELDKFEIEWASPKNFKHDSGWKNYVEGEGDQAAIEAIKAIGGYRGRLGIANNHVRTVVSAATTPKMAEARAEIENVHGKIGRFQVMGLLQAARYYILTGDLEKAKSFGLNRAIFYAWAKRHGKEIAMRRSLREKGEVASKVHSGNEKAVQVGDEVAFISKDGWFIIGGQIQKPQDYDRQIAKPIEGIISYERAWQAAIEYLKGFGRETLLDQQSFFKEVYEPVRDKFLEIVLNPKGLRRDLTRWFSVH